MDRPVWQGTEGRRIQVGHEMAQSGDFVVPTLNHEVTLTKPPVYYWTLAWTERWFGQGDVPAMWIARAPSWLATFAVALVAYFALRKRFSPMAGFLAGAGVVTTPTVIYHGGFAEIDALFSALTAWSLIWLGIGIAERKRKLLIGAGLIGSLALLTKGPPYFLFLAGALLVWWRHRRLRGIQWFLPALLLPCVPWVWMLGDALGGLGEAWEVAKKETNRSSGFGWKHVWRAVPYLLGAIGQALPFGLWTFAEYRGRHEARLVRREVVLRVCAGAGVAGALLLLLSTGRSARYLLPGVMTYVVACAPAVAAYLSRDSLPSASHLFVPRLFAGVAAVGLLVVPWLPFPLPGGTFWMLLVVGLVGVVVRTRGHLVAYAVLFPVLLSWTALDDHVQKFAHGYRSPQEVGTVLRDEVDRLDALEDLEFHGHVSNDVMLHGELTTPPGDEFFRRAPTRRFVIGENLNTEMEYLGGYRALVHVRSRTRNFVILERLGAGPGQEDR